eukprot:TRINITY_DN5475_c2_g1_i1.p1 TRINITY_DN5475_c2_g1~~TRINITY_DN5475_c2_g1_i1.p1  ORF type:complete len:945 (+),score=308.01 TRINITY_DN5475_c2_g1_i1:168-3002(+)
MAQKKANHDSKLHYGENMRFDTLESSMNDEILTLEEKLETLGEKAKEISAFITTLTSLRQKLQKKKTTIREIITKKIEDNEKELKKWKQLLCSLVDESLDEKIEKLTNQETYFKTTYTEFEKVLDQSKTNQGSSREEDEETEENEENESEDPKLDDLLALELNLQPEGLTQSEANEMQSRIKTDFNVLLNEPKKSLRRTFAYVGGIIRGYLRRGKSNINWIKIMRQLEGREFEERMGDDDPYVGTKLPSDERHVEIRENTNDTWNSIIKLFEARHNTELRSEFCEELYHFYDKNPEDVEFYLPQLVNLLLNQYNTFQPLKKFILDKCSQSVHFALQTYLFVRASKDSREKPKKKKMVPQSIIKWRLLCNQILSDIQAAIRLPQSPAILPRSQSGNNETAPFSHISEHHNNLEMIDLFHYPIQFMDNLIDISRHLGNCTSDQYAKELQMRLDQENKLLESYQKGEGGLVYIPLLKPLGSADYHRVVRIPSQEAYAIPTYGRVLYYVVIEVIDKEMDRPPTPSYPMIQKSLFHSLSEEEVEEKKRKTKLLKGTSNHHEENSLSHSSSSVGSANFDVTSSDEQDEPNRTVKEKQRKPSIVISQAEPPASPQQSPPSNMLLSISSNSVPPSPAKNFIPHSTSNENMTRHFSVHPDKPLGFHAAFGELWNKKVNRIKQTSEYGSYDKWRMQPLIVKCGDEVLQEELAMQLINQFQRIFYETQTPITVMPYRILAVTSKSGLIEPVPNSLSLDKLKKQHTNLLNFFIHTFGEPSEDAFKQAQQNFVKTMAAYSVICYILQIKDRHNGNILLDASGHVIHIDFGYFLSKTISFEKAPFKLTQEFVEVMGGEKSPCYKEYRRLCVKGYLAARKHAKKILMLVEMSIEGKGKKVLPCLQGGQKTLEELAARFHLEMTEDECETFFLEMIDQARGSWRTLVYDAYQLILNNIQS